MSEEAQRKAIAERLKLARGQAGLSQGQVAKKLGWHRPTVSEIEAGRRRVAADEVAVLAKLYGLDVNWIINGDEINADPAIQLAARVLAKLKKEDAEKILKLLRRLPRRRRRMNRREELATQAARAAAELRRKRGYRRDVPVCPFDAAVASGAEVWLAAIPSLEGMYSKDRGPAIVVSTERPFPRQVFTASHELGHHEFGHGTGADEYLQTPPAEKRFDPDEFLADMFAAHFLMPPGAVRAGFAAIGRAIPEASRLDMYAVATWLGVGYETLIGHLELTLRLLPSLRAKELEKSSPKAIREELLGGNLVPHLVIGGPSYTDRTIDLRTGDGVLVPPDSIEEGGCVAIQSVAGGKCLAVGVRRGIGRIESPSFGWSNFVRVMPRDFEGQSRFRFDEDSDEND